jgi:Pectate lyase superfamily protein
MHTLRVVLLAVLVSCGSSAGQTREAPVPASGAYIDITTPPFGARGDNASDDSTAIQSAINAAVAQGGGTVLFPPGRTYRSCRTIVVPINAIKVTLTGYGAFLRGCVNGDILQVGDLTTRNGHATYIAIHGLTITGSGWTDTSQPQQNGLGVYAVIGLSLRDVVITNIPNIGMKAVKSQQPGSAFLNVVQLDHVAIRFTGFQGLSYCETGAACDDLTIIGSIFNGLGAKVTTASSASGGVYINAASLHMGFSEVSAVQNVNGSQGYLVALHITNATGVISGMHSENTGANQAGSTAILLDKTSSGFVVTGFGCLESQPTGSRTCIRVRAPGALISGLQQCSTAPNHTIGIVVDAGDASASNFYITGLASCNGATPPHTWVTTAGGGTGTWVDPHGVTTVVGVGTQLTALGMGTAADAVPATIVGVKGLSSTRTAARNLTGACIFPGATICTVKLDTAEADANYRVTLGCSANKTFWVTGKTATQFVVNASSISSDTCEWHLFR